MKYVVTGGAGFVGSYLVDRLANEGHEVIIIDDFSNGSLDNLKGIDVEIRKQNIVTSNIPDCDGIFHLATVPRSFSFEDPRKDIEVNCKGMINVLESAKESGAKVVFTSNSGIAGSMDLHTPIDENYPDRPTTPYDADKLVCEHYCKMYHDVYDVKCANVRFATIYGYRQVVNEKINWRPLVATFLKRMKNHEKVYINGDGNQTRDLTYVRDAVQGVIKAMNSKVENADVAILSTTTETSVNEVFDILKEKTGYTQAPIFTDALKGDLKSMKLSYKKASELYGYNPKYTPSQGIDEMVELFG
jgi:UDP-glucose 4-epimerase